MNECWNCWKDVFLKNIGALKKRGENGV